MSEYWKSTERYWCKHCACYVRDTKLERQNHEATARHQGALKRFLRDLHRGHEQEERNRERARHEIDRLNGVSSGSGSAAKPAAASSAPAPSTPGAPSEADLKKQREQLASMGVEMPDTFRPEMAMPGQWTVTNTRVIEDRTEEDITKAKATGVRKREITEEDKEEEEAVQKLFKKPKRWGRDSKAVAGGGDEDLDSLLSGNLTTAKQEDDGTPHVKPEDGADGDVKKEESPVKAEPDDTPSGIKNEPEEAGHGIDAKVKKEETATETPAAKDDAAAGGVVFKKRKPKNIRQR